MRRTTSVPDIRKPPRSDSKPTQTEVSISSCLQGAVSSLSINSLSPASPVHLQETGNPLILQKKDSEYYQESIKNFSCRSQFYRKNYNRQQFQGIGDNLTTPEPSDSFDLNVLLINIMKILSSPFYWLYRSVLAIKPYSQSPE